MSAKRTAPEAGAPKRDYRGQKIVPKKRTGRPWAANTARAGTAAGAAPSAGTTAPVIRKTMRVSEIVALLPEAGPVIAEYGLHCFHCSANELETLEEGCRGHGFQDEDIDDLVADLNELLASRPPRPQTIAVTEEAAKHLHRILEGEGKIDHFLRVGLDEAGSFCLELAAARVPDEREFSGRDWHGVRLLATSLTLGSIGGATIDFRDGRFKLDLLGESAAGYADAVHRCACGKEECGCGGAGHDGMCGCGAHGTAA